MRNIFSPTVTSKSCLFFLFALSLLMFSSCDKDEETKQEEETVQYASLNEFLQTKKPLGENFEISSEAGGVLNTVKGSVITIPANAFVTQSGQAVTGNVSIKMKEIFSNADMMFSRVFPISNSHILNSGGEFFIQASQNGNDLRVTEDSSIQVVIPAQAADNQMQLFLGGPVEEPDDSVNVNWNPADTLSITGSGFAFNSSDDSYGIIIDTLGWGNIDAFDFSVIYFDCTFNLTGISALDNTNTKAYAVFKEMNTVWPVGYGSISNSMIMEDHLADVPLNLIVISVVDGQLYYGLLDVTPQQDATYSVAMIATTAPELDQVIESLP